MKKSSCGFTDRALWLASSGGRFFSTGGFTVSPLDALEALEIGGGGCCAFGTAVALPKSFGFGDSVCALKMHAVKSATGITINDFMVLGKRMFGVV